MRVIMAAALIASLAAVLAGAQSTTPREQPAVTDTVRIAQAFQGLRRSLGELGLDAGVFGDEHQAVRWLHAREHAKVASAVAS